MLLEHFSTRFTHNNVFKKVWDILHTNAEEGKNSRRVNREMDGVYHRNLLKKAFFPWRR